MTAITERDGEAVRACPTCTCSWWAKCPHHAALLRAVANQRARGER